MSSNTDREFILDPNEEQKNTFWRKIYFNKPQGEASRREYLRCEFEIIDQDELDALLYEEEEGGDRRPRPSGNAALLRRVWRNADIKRKDSEGKVVSGELDDDLREALIKRPYFSAAAAVQYIQAINGVSGTKERKRGN